jgi:hypothetical protein
VCIYVCIYAYIPSQFLSCCRAMENEETSKCRLSTYSYRRDYTMPKLPVSDPSSELGPPTPSPASESPRNQRGEEGNTRVRERGWADAIRTTGEKAWHSVYSVRRENKLEDVNVFCCRLQSPCLFPAIIGLPTILLSFLLAV